MRFFFDNCISPKLAKAMQVLTQPDHQIQHLKEMFSADVDDEEWMPHLAGSDYIIISADPTITKNKKEREVWSRTGLTSFFFGGGFADKGFWVQAHELVRLWPQITLTAKSCKRGSGYLMPFRCLEIQQLFERVPERRKGRR